MGDQDMLISGRLALSRRDSELAERNGGRKQRGLRLRLSRFCCPDALGVVDEEDFNCIVSLGDFPTVIVTNLQRRGKFARGKGARTPFLRPCFDEVGGFRLNIGRPSGKLIPARQRSISSP